MKKDLIEWVLWNSELLMGHKFYCTGTTGTLILEALREKHPDVEWDFTILKSGPLGGDQQMGSRIVDGEIDYLFFFTDPMTLQPHDTDVKALTRLASVENIVFCCNRSTADHIISSPLFLDPTYEAASAMGTVGLTADLTPILSRGSHVILMILMYVGRIGPLTMALALSGRSDKISKFRELPEENVMLG